MIKDCKTRDDFEQILQKSNVKPVFLFKHSTSCPISAGAWERFQQFAVNEDKAEFWRVLVIEDRPLSNSIAEQTGITHQSPQVILFHNGSAVWNESHRAINEQRLRAALDETKH